MKVTLYEICLLLCKISDNKVYDADDISGNGCGNGQVFAQVDTCTHRMSVT